MKTCTKCNKSKPNTEFYLQKRGKNTRMNHCKRCISEYSRLHRIKNRERMLQREAGYRLANKDKIRDGYLANKNKYNKARQAKGGTEAVKEKRRIAERYHRLKKYGLTPLAFDAMFAEQKGCCAICGLKFAKENKAGYRTASNDYPRIDHCHETGDIRGLLCFKCNIGLGAFGDNTDTMTKAITYLLEANL